MRVSVITPAFNAASTLRRMHGSLVAQTMRDWEQIIVNDGSTDATAAIVREIANEDSRVRVLTTPNRGPGAALNAGIAQNRNEFVAFLDADDEYYPDHLAKHLAFFDQLPAVDILWGGVDVITANPEDAHVPDVVKGFGYIHISECVVQGTLFVRRKVFERFAFSEDRAVWYQDCDFVQRAGQVFSVARFHDVTYRYYRNSGASLVDRMKENWQVAQTGGS